MAGSAPRSPTSDSIETIEFPGQPADPGDPRCPVAADLDPSLFGQNTGRRWIRTRRPELYGPLVERTGREEDTRQALREEKKFE